MHKRNVITCVIAVLLTASLVLPAAAQKKGAESISAGDLKRHLTFVASDEMRGRNAPSPELKIVAKYLAAQVESYGFKPLMQDGTFFQRIELPIQSIDEKHTTMTLRTSLGTQEFSFPEGFGVSGRSPGAFSGDVIFLAGIPSTEEEWNNLGGINLRGKMVITLQQSGGGRRRGGGRTSAVRQRGAAGILTIISSQREQDMSARDYSFDNVPAGSFPRVTPPSTQQAPGTPQPQRPPQAQSQRQAPQPIPAPFFQGEIRHDVASAILGIPESDLSNSFALGQLSGKVLSGRRISVSVDVKTIQGYTQNVVAVLEGTDSNLKNEYVLYGAHYDHNGARRGQIWNGADDDGSGTVTLLEVAQAMSIDPPKRSVVMVWHTGEEKGLQGARYFNAYPPIPHEKISAQINMDMVGRNAPDTVFVIGAGRISTELDKSVQDMNKKYVKMGLNYKFDAPNDPQRFYNRSDHYMYAQYGIPIVFLFTDVHDDYHQPTDTVEKINFQKMERIAKLAYYIGQDVANKKELLKLDADPNITVRGKYYPSQGRGR